MARRRTLNRRELRENAEAAERIQDVDVDAVEEVEDEEEVDEDGEPVAKKAVKKAKAKTTKTTKPRTRTAKVVRMKVVWGVYDNSNRRVEVFAYNQRAEADAFVAEKTAEKKTTYFIQADKVPFDEN